MVTYGYLDGKLFVTFYKESETARAMRIRLTPEEAAEGRYEIFEVVLGMHQDEVVELRGFNAIALAAGGVGRIFHEDGGISSVMGMIRVGEIAAIVNIEDEIAVGFNLQKGTG